MEKWICSCIRLIVFFIVSINGLLLLHIYKWRMTDSRIRLIVFFIVSINGLLLLHIYKWRMT
ncbi:hypothetical protein AB0X69_15835, partial [Parabacteroides johnsonii]